MITYITGTVTDRNKDSVDTMQYAATVTEITAENLKAGLNHIYVTGKGFYRILFVLGGTAYLAAPTTYSNGTVVYDLTNKKEQKIKLTESLTLEDKVVSK
jgi:hypothetical protein